MEQTPLSDKKIVVIGGGTGIFPVLTGLKNYFKNLTVVTSAADNGGSAGLLREEFGILPPGDTRRALIALSQSDNKLLSELFNYRFTEGKGLAGHAFGNLMITALERITGSFEKAIAEAGKILGVQGEVLPVTTVPATLVAQFENGEIIRGETNIDIPSQRDGQMKIVSVHLEPKVKLNPRAGAAIKQADLVVIGPGDLFTSLLPNLIVEGMREALKATRAKVAYFVNCMTKYGETAGFAASDFVKAMVAYVGPDVLDYVILNKTKPSVNRVKEYVMERSAFVEPDLENLPQKPTPIVTDLIRSRGLVRHDSEKIRAVIQLLLP